MTKLKLALAPFLVSQANSFHQAKYQRTMAPLGLLYLASHLEKLELPIEILIHDNLDDIIHFKPDIVGIASVSENFHQTQNFAKKLKNSFNPFIILGGAHFTSLPTFLPECFDAGVVGEGEIILENIIRQFLKCSIGVESIREIPGVVTRKENQLYYPGPQASIKNLNEIALPNRKKWIKSLGVPHIMSSRGCIYHCFFCSEPTLFKSYREISAEKIVEEIEDILLHYPQTQHIRFYDDIFTINRKRFQKFCELIQQK
ncbi:MAG: cobalamin-dependent protein, partial [Deltaproteobacteria bacterium]|nr:cobalamin-dependent protein [Deltaproteobacteria bacterium]